MAARKARPATTAQDRAFADAIIARVNEGDVASLATLLANFREVVVSCTVARLEREFVMRERRR